MTSAEDICRVCLEKSNKLYPLLGRIPNVDEDISSMISYCTLIEVTIEDDLPSGVCVPCFRTVRIAYNFIHQFKESNRTLFENRGKHDSETMLTKQEELLQDSNSEEVEEIIIEYKEDFDNDITSDTTNIQLVENKCNDENEIFSECASDDEEEAINYCSIDDIEENSAESNTEDPDEEECSAISENGELQDEPLQDLPESNCTLQKKDRQKFVCPICSQSFSKFEVGFVKHLLKHKHIKLTCNKCSLAAVLTIDLYVQHFRKAHRFQCNVCNKSYGRRSGLYYHIKTHDDRRIFKCSYKNCTKSFLTRWCLRKHLSTHSESSKFICSKCGLEFKTYGSYQYHQKTHDGNRSYLCTVCGQTFLQLIHLKYHMWKHTGIKMFQCNVCPKGYSSQTQLKNHKRKKNHM